MSGFTDLHKLAGAAEWLKVLSHPCRLRMVQMLLNGRFTVGELANACGIPSAQASDHLRLLQRTGLLLAGKHHRNKYYIIADPQLRRLMTIIEAGLCRHANTTTSN